MKYTKLFLGLLACCLSAGASASSQLVCKDSAGSVIFSGIAELSTTPTFRSFNRRQSFKYSALLSDRPSEVVDRATLRRYLGLELPGCNGPYATIYEKDENPGVLRCVSGEVAELRDFNGSKEAFWRFLGLSESEALCSLILTKEMLHTPRKIEIDLDSDKRPY